MSKSTFFKLTLMLLFITPLFNTPVSMFTVFCIGLLYPIYMIKNKEAFLRFKDGVRDLKNQKMSLVFIFISIWSFISFFWSKNLLGLVIGFIYLSLIMFYLSLKFEFNTPYFRDGIINTFLLSELVVCLYLVFQYISVRFIHKDPFLRSNSYSTMENANVFAVFCLMGLFIALSRLRKKNPRWMTLGYSLISLLCLMSVILASSRNVLIALVFGLLLLAYRFRPKYLVAVFTFIASSLFIPRFKSRMLEIFSYEQNVLRVKLWRTALNMTKEHPITGSGLNNFYESYQRYIAENPHLFNNFDTKEMYHAHNIFFRFSSELGLVGLLAIILLIVFSIGSIRKRLSDENKVGVKAYENLNMTYITLITFYVCNAFDSYFSIAKILIIWVMIMGMYAGYVYSEGERE